MSTAENQNTVQTDNEANLEKKEQQPQPPTKKSASQFVPQINPTQCLAYFFSDCEQKIIGYDVHKNILEPIKVETPEIELIFNYTACVQTDQNHMYILGGLNKYNDLIGNAFLCFDKSTLQLTMLPSMLACRYTFSAVFLNNKLYVFGGRGYGTDQEAIMRDCEVFDFATQEWKPIAPMFERRCSSIAFVYKGEIWLLGGYTDKNVRSPIVEKYNPATDTWTKWNWRLYFGVESGHATCLGPGRLLLFGGQNTSGATQFCHEIDLERGSVLNRACMPIPCSLAKLVELQSHVLVFGEDDRELDASQAFNLTNGLWEVFKPSGINHVLTGFKRASVSRPTLIIPDGQAGQLQGISPDVCSKSSFLFGTDDEPFIVCINKETFESRIYPVPLELRLRNYQAVLRISDTEVFFTGGTNAAQSKIVRTTYILDLTTMKVEECDACRYSRFAHQLVKIGDFIYSIGGRQLGNSDVAILNKVERFNLKYRKWERMTSMNFSRCTFNAVACNDKIIVAGGFTHGDTCLTLVEIYDTKKDIWVNSSITLPTELEAGFSYVDPGSNEWVIIGGKTNFDCVDTIFVTKLLPTAPWLSPFESRSLIVQNRCLHKGFISGQNIAIFGGTHVMAHFGEILSRSEFVYDDVLSPKLMESLKTVLAQVNFNGNMLKSASLV
jgi:N-acetylneuraminic acid mutarotase